MEFYFIFVDLVRSFTDSDLPDTDNIVPFENITPITQNKGQNKRTQSRLIRLIEVVFSKGAMMSISYKSESVNESIYTDQQKN